MADEEIKTIEISGLSKTDFGEFKGWVPKLGELIRVWDKRLNMNNHPMDVLWTAIYLGAEPGWSSSAVQRHAQGPAILIPGSRKIWIYMDDAPKLFLLKVYPEDSHRSKFDIEYKIERWR